MMNDVIASIPCNLCNGIEASALSYKSRSGAPLRTIACRGCGLVWSDPRPHDARAFYEHDYRLAYKQTFEPRPKHVLRAGKVALSRLNKIRPHLSGRMRILDVGSGGGEFAYLLKTLGHEVEGIEPNRGYAGYAAAQYGLSIRQGFIGDTELPDATYDLITIWHVLEHTEDPGAVLSQLRRALRPDGHLVVEVPNVEATCQSPSSSFHEAHLFGFNPPSLEALAAKCGLRAHATTLSPDGGNVTAVFRASPQSCTAEGRWMLDGNFDRVAGVVAGHTPMRHWCSVHPYRRLAGRMTRLVTEWRETRTVASARERLDALYASALQPSIAGGALSPKRPLWQWITGAYVIALMLEWILLDQLLPKSGWTSVEAVLLYTLLQTAAVGSIVWLTNRPRTAVQFAKLAAWATPLFALPAYC